MRSETREVGVRAARVAVWVAVGAITLASAGTLAAQRAGGPPPAAPGGRPQSPPWAAAAIRLKVVDGSTAQYRVREQLAGIPFPSDAVGKASGVSGTIEFAADGSIVSSRSKLIVDLRTLTSDQEMRDGFIKSPQILNVEQYPLAEFVPKRVVGLSWPFPQGMQGQAGFQLIGDMTAHGVTKEVTWNVIATFGGGHVSGRADTELTFDTFGIPKPKLARLLSVDDAIKLEIELRMDPEAPAATTR